MSSIIKRPKSDAERNSVLKGTSELIFTSENEVNPEAAKIFQAETIDHLKVYAVFFFALYQGHIFAKNEQSEIIKQKVPVKKAVQKIISHFIQSFNNGIERGSYKISERSLYGLDINSNEVPKLTSENDIILWCDNIINGEQARVAKGGTAMTNPSAADVKAMEDSFKLTLKEQRDKKLEFNEKQVKMQKEREVADALIKDLWDQIEYYFRKSEPATRRLQCRSWGVRYKRLPGDNNLITGTVAPAVVTNILSSGFNDKSIFTLTNTGDAILQFYIAPTATAAAPANAYSLSPGATADIAANRLGSAGNTFLNVFNADTIKEGEFEVEVD